MITMPLDDDSEDCWANLVHIRQLISQLGPQWQPPNKGFIGECPFSDVPDLAVEVFLCMQRYWGDPRP